MVEPKGGAVVAQGGGLNATCNALSSLPTQAFWQKVTHPHTHTPTHTYFPSVKLKPMSVQDGVQIAEGHVLVLEDATFDTAGTYQCVIAVPEMQMQTSGLLLVKVRGKELLRLRMFVVSEFVPLSFQ